MTRAAFVSGHIRINHGEFEQHYIPRLKEAINEKCSFVVGDADGIDLLAQQWLKARNANVTVYHMFENPRHNVGFPTKGGYASDEERDTAMTNNSDFDIVWVRPGKEKSGTAQNIARRGRTDPFT